MRERPAGLLRRAVASLSLANLLGLQVWLVLFRPGQEAPLPGVEFAAAILAVLLLAAGLWSIDALLRLTPEPARGTVRVAGLAFAWVLIAWAALKPSLQQWLQFALGTWRTWLLAVLVVAALLLLAALWRHQRRAMSWMSLAALALSPYVLVTFAHAGWEAHARGVAAVSDVRDATPRLAPGQHRLRTVVLLFDEFDYELAFGPTAGRQLLPALDTLRGQALFARNAYPPMHSTMMSVPAMLTGRLVRDGRFSDEHPGDLQLRFDPDDRELLSTQPTLFSDLRARGLTSLRMNDALLPHARLPGVADADVVVPPAPDQLRSLPDHVAGHLIAMSTLLPFAKGHAIEARLERALGVPPASVHVAQVADQMVDLAGDGAADLLFLHILLPHLPVVFDPTADTFASTTSPDYRDNLKGVDQVVGRILARLKSTGRLDETQLIVVSDHFFRTKRAMYGLGDHRIPFIARFARDERPVGDFDRPFNTVLLRAMLVDVADGDIRDSAGLARWIDAHATFGESPLTEYRKGW